MGRIADALQRAHEPKPEDAGLPTGDRLPGAGSEPRWYGVARSESSTLDRDVDARTHAPSGPPVEGLSKEIVTYYDPSSIVSEQYRSLRTRLLSANPHQEHRIYAVSSAVSREGKSMTTVNLAFTLAEIRHLRILIVDGDLRRGTLARSLNVDRTPGLADVLRSEATYDQIIRSTPAANLYFVPAGRTNEEEGRPQASPRTRTR
ncbi:MAG: CpsD/CapB family tyrosine-protein kinase [Planctomycetes bacterium]|nr:CpsD/CapB family tyrosine-protein kinase [Planctomycetota bacterium]